jgi:hypothetical protein
MKYLAIIYAVLLMSLLFKYPVVEDYKKNVICPEYNKVGTSIELKEIKMDRDFINDNEIYPEDLTEISVQ